MNIAARSRVVAVGFLHIEPKNLTDLYKLQEIGMSVPRIAGTSFSDLPTAL